MQPLFDLLPVIAFFIAYKLAGIYTATAVLIVAVILQVAVQWLRHKKVSKMALTSAVLVLLFGGLTLWLRDESLIKWKMSVMNWLFGLVFLGSQYIGREPLVQRLMGSAVSLEAAQWRHLNWFWVVYFFALGSINYYIMMNFSTDVWANFKLYGVFGLTGVFILIQGWWLTSRIEEPDAGKPANSTNEP